ncbi:hypothetical protein [Methanobrevibacter sp.]|uniref:hypothetical protein n=1 Tax=Methanobrevibacter sp. TaxID=66852 RepID=UPI00388ED204
MGIFNKIGDIKKRKNQFKLFKMLMQMGLNKPNEMTSVCATVITSIAVMHELPEEDFKQITNGMLEKYAEVKNDPEIQEEMNSKIVRVPYD